MFVDGGEEVVGCAVEAVGEGEGLGGEEAIVKRECERRRCMILRG